MNDGGKGGEVSLWLCCEGWVRFGPFAWLRFDERATILDDRGKAVAVRAGGGWYTPGSHQGYHSSNPMVSASPRRPHPHSESPTVNAAGEEGAQPPRERPPGGLLPRPLPGAAAGPAVAAKAKAPHAGVVVEPPEAEAERLHHIEGPGPHGGQVAAGGGKDTSPRAGSAAPSSVPAWRRPSRTSPTWRDRPAPPEAAFGRTAPPGLRP
jgi:hypothetical protein